MELTTPDGIALESELALPDTEPAAAVVLCHPHPQFGGTMRSIVISALFQGLPAVGFAALRFNFRGVEGSGGAFDDGPGEFLDAQTALDALATAHSITTPIVMIGWSFGGGIALSVTDERLRGWIGIAPSLRDGAATITGTDRRPKLIITGAHDAVVSADTIESQVAGWSNTRVETVAGADHFFVGRTDRVLALVNAFLRSDQ